MTNDTLMTNETIPSEVFDALPLLDQFAIAAMQRINAGNMITKPDNVAAEAYSYALAAMRHRKKAHRTLIENSGEYV